MKLTATDLRRTADAMDAFDEGKPVQMYYPVEQEWRDVPDPSFSRDYNYRPKPMLPEPPVVDRMKAAQAIDELRKALNL